MDCFSRAMPVYLRNAYKKLRMNALLNGASTYTKTRPNNYVTAENGLQGDLRI